MNEVKSDDINLVLDSLAQYGSHLFKTSYVDLKEFYNFMEPVFKKAGYRQPPQTGGDGCNILIIHDSAAGDLVHESGAIREIRRIYPTANITLICAKNAFPLAERCPYVNKIIRGFGVSYNFSYSYQWFINLSTILLKTRFDYCYAFIHAAETPLLAYMSGARIRILNYIWKENAEFFRTVPYDVGANLATYSIPPYTFGKHDVDACFSLIDYFLDNPVSNRELEVWYTPSEFSIAKNLVGDLSRPLYALVMGANQLKRRYPPEKFAELVKMILNEEPNATFINFGGGKADEVATKFFQQQLGEEIFKKHVINLVGKTNFRIDAAIMSFCDMYIGNNTGNKDMAMAVKCPLLLAECFPKELDTGHLDIPRLYGPYKVPAVSVQPKHALPECKINKPYHPYGCRADIPHCITQIQPETLFKGFKLLKEKIAKKFIDTTYIC